LSTGANDPARGDRALPSHLVASAADAKFLRERFPDLDPQVGDLFLLEGGPAMPAPLVSY